MSFTRNDAVDFAWLDIEDCADWLEPVDIEDFPTVLIAQNWEAVFFGPVTPQLQTLKHILGHFMQTRSLSLGGEAQALLERARAGPDLRRLKATHKH